MEEPQIETEPQGDDSEELEEQARPGRSQWIAPAWFLLGVLIGVIGMAVFAMFSKPQLDETTIRQSAREGMLDAIATLNATQGQIPERGTPAPVKTSFNLRDTNRVGNKSAKVTIVEFSDFQ
jgi:protein-disulfide isomerase